MEFQVIVTTKAGRDLEKIGRYIALNDFKAAERFCEELFNAAQSLVRLPRRGHLADRQRNIRWLIYKSYLIFYKIDEETRKIEVLRFWHAAQDQRHLRLREAPAVYGLPVGPA